MFRAYNVFSMLRPARPRHPIVQALLALFAVCAFIVLLVFGAAVAAVVMLVAIVLRAFGSCAAGRGGVDRALQTGAARAGRSTAGPHGDVIDGEFSVVEKTLPHGTH